MDLKVISIYDGDESLNRETQFQKNEAWTLNLINLKSDSTWINQKAPSNSIWIMKLNGKSAELKSRKFKKLVQIDGWYIMRLEN